jgi:RNA polymerase sigma-70 factor (ECF subfamily)
MSVTLVHETRHAPQPTTSDIRVRPVAPKQQRRTGSAGLESVVHRAVADPEVYSSILRYLGSLCRDVHFAEDLAQDAVVRAIERARDFRGEGSVDGWLKAIARTTFLMAIRAKRESPGCEVDNEVPSAEDMALEKLDRDDAKEAVRGLSPPDRRLVDLYYGLGLSISCIAAQMSTTECAVKCRLYRLRLRLAASPPVSALAEQRLDA